MFEQAHLTPPRSILQQMHPKSLLTFVSETLAPLARSVHSMLNSHDAEISSETNVLKSSEEIDLDAIRLKETEVQFSDATAEVVKSGKALDIIGADEEELCVICSEIMSPGIRLEDAVTCKLPEHSMLAAPCGHAFCLSCWKQFYTMEVNEGRGEVIRCPGNTFSLDAKVYAFRRV